MDGNRKAAPGAAGAANEKNFDTFKHTSPAPKALRKGHLTNSYEDFRRIIQKTVRRYPALETALSALSMLSIVLTAGLAEQRPAWATVAALAGMLAALTLRGADCSTTGVPSRTESNRRRVDGSKAMASRGILRASPSSPWNGRRGRTTCER